MRVEARVNLSLRRAKNKFNAQVQFHYYYHTFKI